MASFRGVLLQFILPRPLGMSPFVALYGYEAPSFDDLMFSDSKAPQAKDMVQQCQDILKSLKNNLQFAQNQ